MTSTETTTKRLRRIATSGYSSETYVRTLPYPTQDRRVIAANLHADC
jgi:hypothetical protein